MMNKDAHRLARSGVILFLLGLLLGAAIPLFTNPRMALSAHLTAVQCGTALVAFGLLWPHVHLTGRLSTALSNAIVLSIYVLTLGLSLAAVFGASQALPIAGAGHQGLPWQELVVTVLVLGSSLVMTIAIAVWLWKWKAQRSLGKE